MSGVGLLEGVVGNPWGLSPPFGTMKCHGSSVNSDAPFFISWCSTGI